MILFDKSYAREVHRLGVTARCVIVLLLAVAPSTAQMGDKMTKKDFAGAGFSITLPTDPGFDTELRELGFGQNEDSNILRPLSIILKNSSDRSIVAFALRWTISDSTGLITTHDQSYVAPSGLLDGIKERRQRATIEHQIREHGLRLVTAGGMARTEQELHALAMGRAHDTSQFSVVAVALDAAIFDNGEYVGTDELGMVSRFQAHVNAEQDLMSQIHSRVTAGEGLQEILADIRKSMPPDREEIPTTPALIYEATKRNLLNELETTERTYGDEMALRTVEFHRYENRPVLRRKKVANQERIR